MKRRQFIQLSVAASVVGARSLSADTGSSRNDIFVAAGTDRDDKPIEIPGLGATFHVKVSGKDTEGRCVIFDTIRRQKVGPALHYHTDCDEWFFVEEGQFKFQAGDKILHLKAGDSLLVPREMPHAFVKTSDGDARLIIMHQPAVRMEEYFRILSQQQDPSVEVRKKIAAQYGAPIIGPPLTPD